MQNRKVSYRLYPSKTQALALREHLRLHQLLYNAALQQRIEAWRRSRTSLSYQTQCRDLTALRREYPEFTRGNCSSQQRTLRRLDIAFQAFFRRVAAKGSRAGFPRFKSLDGFPGFGFKAHGDGWRFTPGADWRHGKLRLQHVGTLKARGRARAATVAAGARIKACEIRHNAGRWTLSLTIECDPTRQGGRQACGLDWGTRSFASLALQGGDSEIIANPRLGAGNAAAVRRAARAVSRKRRGSQRRRRAVEKLRRLRWRQANRRREFLHQASARLIGRFALIATEKLQIKNMTRSAKGTIAEPGKQVRQKAGLNREILDTAPGQFLALLRYKALEAGSEIVEAPTRQLKPSQRCPACWSVAKKTLSTRTHACHCGHREDRDVAAARVMLTWALNDLTDHRAGTALRETSAGMSPPARETPSNS